MKAIDLRNKYLEFFTENGHKVIPSAPLLPENDPTVLFTTAGMHPLITYFLGNVHPQGRRITDYQKCIRTGDIDEVGDDSHLTFFEMMGNWSFGDYFKEESIELSYRFLTEKLGIDANRISVTVFEGDQDAPKDKVAFNAWVKAGIPEDRIYFSGKKTNWWGLEKGPCGPDTEIFYDTLKPKCSDNCSPLCDCGKYLEIWNNVFTEYNKIAEGKYELLSQKNVDTGLGLERVVMILDGKKSVYETELFVDVMNTLKELAGDKYIEKSARVIADHMRAALMIMVDGVVPSNVEQGYVLRRLIRRLIRHMRKMEIDMDKIVEIANITVEASKEMYPEIDEHKEEIITKLVAEKDKFVKTLEKGEKEFNKYLIQAKNEGKDTIDAEKVFKLYDTFGFPVEITEELATENGIRINVQEFNELFKKHQELSRQGSNQKFKGGLANDSEIVTQYHTATHLLHKALQIVLGEHATQSGSNITEERLRFDFKHPQKVTREELDEVERIVNEQIQKDLVVKCEEMTLDEAKESGATGLFENKYGDLVKVYSIGDFSKEICGGPHVERTGNMGRFKIKKEEASSAGVRRIKAVLIKE
ncbi:MAG: alanine--tRNA ligase [Clostridiales bacterium]|nr:alanine--tRNA ligase [Clostridiales bacterium]